MHKFFNLFMLRTENIDFMQLILLKLNLCKMHGHPFSTSRRKGSYWLRICFAAFVLIVEGNTFRLRCTRKLGSLIEVLIRLFETRIETTLSIHLKITPKNISVSSDASGRRKAQGKGRPLCDYRTKL